MVAADVPLLPRVIPAPSVTNVKLTDATVVAVTATVPVALVAEAGTPTNAVQATSTTIANSFLVNFPLSWISWNSKVPHLSQHSSKGTISSASLVHVAYHSFDMAPTCNLFSFNALLFDGGRANL
jgi:hypothetical protein